MCSDIYRQIKFKLGMMTDSAGLHILILVYVTVTSIKGHRDAKKQKNFCTKYLPYLRMDLHETWHIIETCWSDEFHAHLTLSDQYSRKRIQLR